MDRCIVVLVLALAFGSVHAELRPPARNIRAVTDSSMIVMDRGARLEVFPAKRAMLRAEVTGQSAAHQVVSASASSPIGPTQLGVVFNHATQQQGYITGEIAFKMKAGHTADGLSPSQYPGLTRITEPAVYVVKARTPAEFVKLTKRLQARTDVEWVEPTVTYGAQMTARPDPR
jgi:hypothetical protein